MELDDTVLALLIALAMVLSFRNGFSPIDVTYDHYTPYLMSLEEDVAQGKISEEDARSISASLKRIREWK